MATFVDALAISIGLDSSAYNKGAAQVAASMRKTKEAATKTGKDIESASQKAADSIDRIARNALKLFAIFTAGRAIKDFVTDITNADSALGRLATRIGQAPGDISAVASAVNRTGGSFDAAAGSFQRFSDSIQELKTTGNTAILPTLYKIQAAGGRQINLNKDISQTYEDLADNLKAINDTQGAATANYLGRQLGLDEGTIALLVKGSAAYRAQVAASKQLGIATKADTEAAQNLQTSIRTLTQASEGLGRTIMTAVTPIIVELLKPLEEWIKANREWVATEITARVREFGDYLKTIDWASIGRGIRDFISGANDAAKAIGGWKVAAELFFGLWAATRIVGLFAPLFAQLALVRLTLLRMGPIGWGLLGLGALAGALATADPNKAIVSGGKDAAPNATLNPGDELPGAGPATPRSGDGGGPGLLRRGYNRVRGWFGGGEHEGGAGIRARANRAKKGPDGIPYEAKSLNEGVGISPKQYDAYREGLTDIEGKSYTQVGGSGGRYSGRYQFGPTEIKETALKLGERPPTRAQFLADPAMQERYMERYTLDHHNYLMRHSAKYRDLSPEKKLEILGYAHNQGAGRGGALTYLETGQAGKDGFGTSGTAYFDPIRRRLAKVSADTQPPSASQGTPKPTAMQAPKSPPPSPGGTLAERAAASFEYGPQTGYPNSRSLKQMNEWLWNKQQGPQPIDWKQDKDTGNWKPVFPKPSAWNGIPNATSFVAQAQSAQAAMASNTSNDNRSTVSHDTRFNGPITIQTASTDPDGIARDMEGALRKRSFAMGSNYGQA